MPEGTRDTAQTSPRNGAGPRWLLAALVVVLLGLAGYWLLGGVLPGSGEQVDPDAILPAESRAPDAAGAQGAGDA